MSYLPAIIAVVVSHLTILLIYLRLDRKLDAQHADTLAALERGSHPERFLPPLD